MKKKRKLTGQQIKFMINMVSLAIFTISYLYIYSYFLDKTDATYQEINIVTKYITTMADKISREETVKQETEELDTQIQAIIDNYPVDITKVDNLLFVEQMEKELGITFNAVNPSDSSPFFYTILPMRNADGTEITQSTAGSSDEAATIDTPAVQTDSNSTGSEVQSDALSDVEAAVGEDTGAFANASNQTSEDAAEVTTMTGMQSTITMNFLTTYEGFQKLVDYINNYPSKTVIDSVSVSVDRTTNKLTGSLVIKRFALAGTGKSYEAPIIDDISIGTDDIFGTDNGDSDGPTTTDDPATTEEPSATEGLEDTQQETP